MQDGEGAQAGNREGKLASGLEDAQEALELQDLEASIKMGEKAGDDSDVEADASLAADDVEADVEQSEDQGLGDDAAAGEEAKPVVESGSTKGAGKDTEPAAELQSADVADEEAIPAAEPEIEDTQVAAEEAHRKVKGESGDKFDVDPDATLAAEVAAASLDKEDPADVDELMDPSSR